MFVMYCVNGESGSSLLIYRVYRLYDIRRILHSSKVSVGLAQVRPNYTAGMVYYAVLLLISLLQ